MKPAMRGALVVAFAAVVAGLTSLPAGFVHDDHRLIEENRTIRGLAHPLRIVAQGYWTVDANQVPNLWRPATILSFALNRALLGTGPFGFRVVDLLLHVALCVLVFHLARRIVGSDGEGRVTGGLDAPLIAGLLFAVHPVHTEALGLVVGRAEILAAIGAIGAVLLFLAARDRAGTDPRGARLSEAGALVAFGFGFLAKEIAVATPFLVLLADTHRVGVMRRRGDLTARPAYGVHAIFLFALAGLVAARTAVLGMVSPAAFTHFIDNPIAHRGFPASTATALDVVARYARLLVAPFGLSLEYSYDAISPLGSILAPRALLGLLVVAAVVGGALLLRRRHPGAAFGLAWIAVAFAPVSNLLLPIGTIMAERLLYLPSVGFVLVAGCAGATLAARPGGAGRVARAAIVALLATGALLSALRLRDFRDDLTLQAATVATTPRSVRAQFNYGAAQERAGDPDAAVAAYEAAIAIWPDFSDAQYNLAGVLMRQDRSEPALTHYREALRMQPGNVSYLVNYGFALTRAGRPAEAIEPLERAVDLDRDSDRAWNNLGGARLAVGRADAAALAWREAIRIDPGNPEYAVNLALALDAADDPGAVTAWTDAVTRRPEDGLLRYRLGRALERAGRDDEAASAYRESARLAAESPVPRRALGLLLERRGDAAGARAALEETERLDPGGTVFDAEARALLDRLRSGRP